MNLSTTGSILAQLLLIAVAVVGVSIVAWLGISASRGRERRWIKLGTAMAVIGAAVLTWAIWLGTPRVGGNYCVMDSLSDALASSANTPTEQACQSEGQRRLATGLGLAVVVFAGGGFVARRRPAAERRAHQATAPA